MTNQLESYRTYSRFSRRLLLNCGMWPARIKNTPLYIMYHMVSLIGIFLLMFVLFGLLHFCREHMYDMGQLTRSTGHVISVTQIMLKVISFVVCRQDLRKLIDELRKLMDEVLEDRRLWPVIFSNFKSFHYSSRFIFLAVVLTVGTTLTSTFIIMGLQFAKVVENKRCWTPYVTSYPFLGKNCDLRYMGVAMMQTVCAVFIMFITPSPDIFFGYSMFQISAILRVMAYEVKNADSKNYEAVLKKCIERHTKLVACRNILQSTYSAMVMYIALTNALTLCSLMFQAYHKMTLSNSIKFIPYMLLKLSQPFWYAWYGNSSGSESDNFQEAVYGSQWYEYGNNAYMRGVLITLSQKPMDVKAFTFFPISMDLFTGVVNTSVSYFFLIKTLDEALGPQE